MAQAIANGRVFVGSWKDPNAYTVYVNWLDDGTAIVAALTYSAQRAGIGIDSTLNRSALQDVTAEVFSGPVPAVRQWSEGITGGAKVIRNKFYQEAFEECAS